MSTGTDKTAPDDLAGPTGVILVGDLEITVTPLTQVEERSLRRQLRAAAKAWAGDYFTRCAEFLKAMRDYPDERMEVIRDLGRLTATGPTVSEAHLWEYRNTPEGVATELYARGRKATPGLDLKGLRAVITLANVDDVIVQVEELLGAAKKA